jgi:hypothetical protein
MGFIGCGPSRAQQIQNLLVNGGFESGAVSPWTTYGGATTEVVTTLVGAVVPEGPIEGRFCLHVTVPTAGANSWNVVLQPRGAVFAKGKKYTLSAFLKCKKGVLQVNFKPELETSPWTGYGARAFTMTQEWREYYVTTPVFDSDVSPAGIAFHIGFAAAEFWIDDARFYEGDYVPRPVNGVVELWGDQVISGSQTWSGNRYKIHGNLWIKPGGELTVEDATIEMMCTYDREFWIIPEGTLRTTRCIVGGTPPIHTMIQLEGGWWYATDTTVQYTYGTGFAWDRPSYLRANRLTAGVSSDCIGIGGYADVIVTDSTYPISVEFDASAGGTTTLDPIQA